MNHELWQRLKPLFNAAMEKDAQDRDAFIDTICQHYPELKEELLALIRAGTGPLDENLIDHLDTTLTELTPGIVLADRYRIVDLLGRGGMGQVYRAEDLTLNQTVALKFVSFGMATDPEWLARIVSEVRSGRVVTHPNVCRVHDIVHAQTPRGSEIYFLSMEYVDGEDLATLQRRSGGIATERALQIAGQITAGLAAAHRRGVLHRDIKPANVLVDRLGQAKLADFGLAVIKEAAVSEMAGTPGYIAPEVLNGEAHTERSDLYSLGIVLFELFTNSRPQKEHRTRVSLLRRCVPGLSEMSCRTIVNCLEADASERPSSATEVLKALPFDDPLDAALSRGEIPSPEMVATSDLEVPWTWWKACLSFSIVVLAVLGIWLIAPYGSFLGVAPPRLSPAKMQQKSREYLQQLGYSTKSVPNVSILNNNDSLLDFLSFNTSLSQNGRLGDIGQGSLILTYRQSSIESLLSQNIRDGIAGSEESSYASGSDPSPLLPGMISAEVDSNGHLLRVLANPDPSNEGTAHNSASSRADWNWVVTATGVDPASVVEMTATEEQRFTSPFPFTASRAWRANYPGHPENVLAVNATEWRGRFNWIEVTAPWNQVKVIRGMPALAQLGVPAIILSSLLLAGVVARRNLRLNQGDVRSALRLAGVSMMLSLATAVCAWHSAALTATDRIHWTFLELASVLAVGAGIWLAYIAVEPLARKRMPRLLVSSSQLLHGQWGSSLLGKEILTGAMLGAGCELWFQVAHAYTWTRWVGASLNIAPVTILAGGQESIYAVLWRISNLPRFVAQYTVLYVILRVTFRTSKLATFTFFVCMLFVPSTRGSVLTALPVHFVIAASSAWIFARTGLAAAASYLFTLSTLDRCPWPETVNSWMVVPQSLSLCMLLTLCATGFALAVGLKPFPHLPHWIGRAFKRAKPVEGF